MVYLSRSNTPLAIPMRIYGDLSLCIPLPARTSFPITVLRDRLGQLVHFKEATSALSSLCNDGDTLGHTENGMAHLVWIGEFFGQFNKGMTCKDRWHSICIAYAHTTLQLSMSLLRFSPSPRLGNTTEGTPGLLDQP